MAKEIVKPKEFQKGVLAEIEAFNGRALVALDPGLGKTIISLQFLRRQAAWPAIVICPAAVKSHWEHEAITQIGVRATVADGRTPPKDPQIEPPKLLIINFDILPYWVPYLKSLNPVAIIVDESQNISNRGTHRSKATKELCKRRKHVLALSGTPLLNRPSELWATLNIVRPDLFTSFWSYAQDFCGPRLLPWGWTYNGATNLGKLKTLLDETCMTRRLKSEVLHELPAVTNEIVVLPLSDPKEYLLAQNDYLTWLKRKGLTKVAAAEKAQRLTQIGYLRRLAARLKCRSVINWTTAFLNETNEKIVLFCIHTKMIDALQKNLEFKSVRIDGGVSRADREVAVKQFQNDPKTRVMVGNILAMGTGVDGLQNATQNCALCELPWRPGDVTQAISRLHRMGQENHTYAAFLIGEGTIEYHLCDILQKKQSVLSHTLDGGEREEDLPIFDELEKKLAIDGGFLQ